MVNLNIAKRTPFWAQSSHVALTLAVLAIGLAVSIVAMHNYSANEYGRAIEMREVNLQGYDLMAAGWRAVNDFAFPATGDYTPESWAAEQTAAITALTSEIQDYYDNFADKGPASVRVPLAEDAVLHQQILTLVQQGRPYEGIVVANQALAKFTEMHAAADAASTEYSSSAKTINTISTAGVLLAVLATLAGGLIVYWRFRVARRRIDQVEEESEILRRSEARFRPLIQSSTDMIAVVDSDSRIKFASPSLGRALAIDEDTLVGRSLADLGVTFDLSELEAFIADVAARPHYSSSTELQMSGPSGATLHAEVVCTNLLDDPDVGGLVLNVRDVSERHAFEEQLRRQAFQDSLTGLANRLRFTDRLEHALLLGRRSASRPLGVLYADLDYFKDVNDDLGHTIGDALLVEFAQRLQAILRPTDTAARLGGDEFGVLLEDVEGLDDARTVAGRLLTELLRPFRIADHDIVVSASIGIVMVDPKTMTAEEVMRDADVAMYDAKKNGRGRAQVYEHTMRDNLVARLHLVNDLNRAIERGEFRVFYQPVLGIDSERITGFEALVRWDHPSRGLLLPGEFISVAEDTGAILALGETVLIEACVQAQEWQERFPKMAGLTMSVNVSAKQVQRPGFVEVVERALARSGLDPEMLIIEITETAFVSQPERVTESLVAVKALGVKIALDDFGTGYSSLGHLKQFPIDILKIDRSFVEDLDTGEKEGSLVRTVIDLGRTLNLHVIAEGIESREQLDRLRELHCQLGQGFLFSRPLPAPDIQRMLDRLPQNRRKRAPKVIPAAA